MTETERVVLTDKELKLESLKKMRDQKQELYNEIETKKSEVEEMIELTEGSVEDHPVKIDVLNDALDLIIEEHDFFIGDNPEVLVGTDLAKYEHINIAVEKYKEDMTSAELELDTFKEVSDNYDRQLEVVSKDYERIDSEIKEIRRSMGAIGSDTASKKGKSVLPSIFSFDNLIIVWISVAFMVIISNSDVFKTLMFDTFGVTDPLIIFPLFMTFTMMVWTFFPRKKRRRRRRYKP